MQCNVPRDYIFHDQAISASQQGAERRPRIDTPDTRPRIDKNLECSGRVGCSVLERSITTKGGILGAWEAIELVINGEMLRPALEEAAEAYQGREKFEEDE